MAGSGKPLPDAVRSYFEPRFGYDFSRVRVHTDPRAVFSASALGARAYTVGQDVVLGEGQYAPQTGEGRRLLAYELAHVVQQSSGGLHPMIQRRLLVTGDKADVKTMLGLLEPASGFSLKHDPKTNEVSVTASVLKPPSFVLAGELATIMDDPKQDAEIHLGRKQKGVHVGAFPDDPEKAVQEIRIDQVLALEKGAPGSGVAKLAHEIVENYEAPRSKRLQPEHCFERITRKGYKDRGLDRGRVGTSGFAPQYFFGTHRSRQGQTPLPQGDRGPGEALPRLGRKL